MNEFLLYLFSLNFNNVLNNFRWFKQRNILIFKNNSFTIIIDVRLRWIIFDIRFV
jgi:hypothetical protein